MSCMRARLLSIGDFARMTYLTVKTLRHYHDIGLLEPADVDPATGYRRYTLDQVPVAQVIRRFRDLDMPLEDLTAIVRASDVETRNTLVTQHLERMEVKLAQTRETVDSLRNLINSPCRPLPVTFSATAPTPVLAVREVLDQAAVPDWIGAAFGELHAALRTTAGIERQGPDGGLYAAELFDVEYGEVTAFVPVSGDRAAAVGGRVEMLVLPAAEYTVATHTGPLADLDQTFAALGAFVAEHAVSIGGPMREHYLTGRLDAPTDSPAHIEVCWPVFRTSINPQ